MEPPSFLGSLSPNKRPRLGLCLRIEQKIGHYLASLSAGAPWIRVTRGPIRCEFAGSPRVALLISAAAIFLPAFSVPFEAIPLRDWEINVDLEFCTRGSLVLEPRGYTSTVAIQTDENMSERTVLLS